MQALLWEPTKRSLGAVANDQLATLPRSRSSGRPQLALSAIRPLHTGECVAPFLPRSMAFCWES